MNNITLTRKGLLQFVPAVQPLLARVLVRLSDQI